MNINRCVCHEVPFSSLLPIVDELQRSGTTDEQIIFDTLRKQTKCATGCSLCSPYIRRLIATGETSF